jgi:hypothetical protein
MNFRLSLVPLVALLAGSTLVARQDETLSAGEIRAIIRESADRDMENMKRRRDYTYVRRDEERRLDKQGRVKSTESKTYEITILAGEIVERLIAKDDKPLSEKEARNEEEKVQKIISRSEKENEKQRRKRLAKNEKEAEEARLFVREIADAYKFRFLGTEVLNGRPAYVIDADPLPGYKPRLKDAKFLPKFRFRAWIDQAERHWVKLDAECIDTVSWGLFLARLHKGSKIHLEAVRINDEVWLPRHLTLNIDARIALLKNLDMELDITFRDYQKFRADSVIRPLGEVQ